MSVPEYDPDEDHPDPGRPAPRPDAIEGARAAPSSSQPGLFLLIGITLGAVLYVAATGFVEYMIIMFSVTGWGESLFPNWETAMAALPMVALAGVVIGWAGYLLRRGWSWFLAACVVVFLAPVLSFGILIGGVLLAVQSGS